MSGVTPESTTAGLAASVPKQAERQNSDLPGTFPETPAKEAESFSVNPIPASSGASNPVKLQPGEKVPDPSTTHENTVESTVRTDPEGYEQDASAELAGLASASNPASNRRRQSKIIPDSGLPVEGESVGLTDMGVTVETAAPAATTTGLASQVPLESQKKQAEPGEGESESESEGEGEGEGEGAGAVSEVPSVVRNSLSEARRDPEAAASKGVVAEKKEFENELQQKVPPNESGGTPGPTTSAATTETAPVAAPTESQSTPLSPRSTPPPKPSVTTGVARGQTSEVTNPTGGASTSEGPTTTSGPVESKAPAESGPGAATSGGQTAPKRAPETSPSAEQRPNPTQTGTTGQAESKTEEIPTEHQNGTVRKDYADKAREQGGDAAKDQKKKNRTSFFQKLKEKFK